MFRAALACRKAGWMIKKAKATGSKPQSPDLLDASRQRSTDDSTVDRILSVAERRFAVRGFTNVTVREIAAEAGVTHPVIYDHFGSKQGLLTAVLERSQSRRRVITASGLATREAVMALARDTLENSQDYIRILGRAFLDGMPPADWPGGYPGVEHVLALLTAESDQGRTSGSGQETRMLLAAALATLVGWMLLEDQLLAVVGLPEADRDAAREELLGAFQRVLEPALAAAERREGR